MASSSCYKQKQQKNVLQKVARGERGLQVKALIAMAFLMHSLASFLLPLLLFLATWLAMMWSICHHQYHIQRAFGLLATCTSGASSLINWGRLAVNDTERVETRRTRKRHTFSFNFCWLQLFVANMFYRKGELDLPHLNCKSLNCPEPSRLI